MSAYERFVKVLSMGEKVLHISYSDYNDAFEFSAKYFFETSKHFIEHFKQHSTLSKGSYESDLIRYIFIKSIEQRISSDIFANTTRGNVCDIFYSPFDIFLPSYPTNMPLFLEKAINERQKVASALAARVLEVLSNESIDVLPVEALNAVQFLGQTVGYQVGQENRIYKSYRTNEMLTRNEINELAGHNLCTWLSRNEFEISEANFSRDTFYNIIARQGKQDCFILMSAEVAPEEAGFIPQDLNNLYSEAYDSGAVPYYASVNVASKDTDHFSDGVLLFGDQVMFRVNAFAVLEKEE